MSLLADWLPFALAAAAFFSLIFILPDDREDEALTLDDLLPSCPAPSHPTALDRYLGPGWAIYDCSHRQMIDSS